LNAGWDRRMPVEQRPAEDENLEGARHGWLHGCVTFVCN
jgi:hypothetical protein